MIFRIVALLLVITTLSCAAGEPDGGDSVAKDSESTHAESQKSDSTTSSEQNAIGNLEATTTPAGEGGETSGQTDAPGTVRSISQTSTNDDEPSAPSSRASTGDDDPANAVEYDARRFGTLLSTNVASGRVDYKSFGSSAEFEIHVASLETASLDGLDTDEQLAFWINAYNALVIKNVLDHPGTKSPLDVKGFFDNIPFTVAGRTLTLNGIENDLIRPTFKEPLIHFGLVCAAQSCPPLVPTLYTGANVRSLLATNARAYLADNAQNGWDASKKRLRLSKIFEWYIVDFGNDHDGLRTFAGEYGTAEMKKAIEGGSVKVFFQEYDWRINSK